ncbi:MAG: hypothetical protein ACHP65_03565 [Legionellales bacterium]
MPWPSFWNKPEQKSKPCLQNQSEVFPNNLPDLELNDTQRFVRIQKLIAEVTAESKQKAVFLTKEKEAHVESKANIKNWLARLSLLVPSIIVIPPLGFYWNNAATIEADYIENVLKPSCSIQWPQFSSWFMQDDSCVSLFNCTGSLCSTAMSYDNVTEDYFAGLATASAILGAGLIVGGVYLLFSGCKPYTPEYINRVADYELWVDSLEQVLSLDLRRRIAGVLKEDLQTVSLRSVSTIVNELTLEPEKHRHSFFKSDSVAIGVNRPEEKTSTQLVG